ncbi:hypothetical protein [Fibrella aquatica]|uniref:hypothetical protein n=1 Tax=Fibrella aquatica TaxID=3242487 RepID=UPI003520D002
MISIRYVVSLCLLCLGLVGIVNAQTADLRLVPQLSGTNGQFSATIQIRASDATSFSIGTSSVFLSYNPASLSFVGYQSLGFDNTTSCNGQFLWDTHSFDASTPGLFNLTLNLNSTTVSCPVIGNADWVSMGTLTFTVRNPAGNPGLLFNAAFTSFNTLPGNNGSAQIGEGQYTGLNQAGVLQPCSLSVSAEASACNQPTNTYTVSGTVSVANASSAGVLSVSTDASPIQSVSYAAGTTTVPFSLSGLTADGVSHTISVSSASCGTATTTYTAPVSCSCTSPVIGLFVTRQASCVNQVIQADAAVSFTATGGDRYSIVPDGQAPAGYATATSLIAGEGSLIGLTTPSAPVNYRIRVYNGTATCYSERTVLLQPTSFCDCPSVPCLLITADRVK